MDEPIERGLCAQVVWSEPYDGTCSISLTTTDLLTAASQTISVMPFHPVEDPLALFRGEAAEVIERLYSSIGVQLRLPF